MHGFGTTLHGALFCRFVWCLVWSILISLPDTRFSALAQISVNDKHGRILCHLCRPKWDSAADIEPGDYLRPDLGLCLAPDEDPEMLQANSCFARIFEDAHLSHWHRVSKRCDRDQGGHIVSHVYDRKRRNRYAGRTNEASTERQISPTKAIFTIKPLDNLVHQFAGKRNLVESPSLNSGMNFERVMVIHAENCVPQPRPYECIGRC